LLVGGRGPSRAIVNVLDVLALTVGELAAYLLLRHHTVVELADQLANLGLIRRFPDPGEGRRVLLRLMERESDACGAFRGSMLERFEPSVTRCGEVIKSLKGDEERSA
jgi:hypothetical protein